MADTYSKEVYHWRKEHGICTRCGKQEAVVGTKCGDCAYEEAERKKQKYDAMSEAEKREFLDRRNEKRRAASKERKEKKLCSRCGKPAYKNHSLCYEHYLYQKKMYRKYAEESKKGYAEIGKCRICGKDTVEGKKFCEEHLKQYREKMAYASQFIKRGGNNERGIYGIACVDSEKRTNGKSVQNAEWRHPKKQTMDS